MRAATSAARCFAEPGSHLAGFEWWHDLLLLRWDQPCTLSRAIRTGLMGNFAVAVAVVAQTDSTDKKATLWHSHVKFGACFVVKIVKQ